MKMDEIFKVLLLVSIMHFEPASSACYSTESCLYTALMADYNNQVRPVSGPTGTVEVSIILDIYNILGLDEKNEVLESVFSMAITWKDHFLSWNSTTYPITRILINVKNIWLPDMAIINSVEEFYKKTFLEDFRALITDEGKITWTFGGVFKTSCSMDITLYPFDSQTCTIIAENFAYTEGLVNLTSATLVTNNLEENSLWTLTNSYVERETFMVASNEYPRVTFSLVLMRKTTYYAFNILLPMILVLCAAMGVFWLPPDCGEKISLGITVLLAFSVFQIVIMDNTPVNSETTPFISKLVMTTMVMATLSVISAMLAVYLHFKGCNTRVPRWLRFVAFKILAKVLFLKNEAASVEENFNEILPAEEENQTGRKKSSNSEMSQILRQLMVITELLKGQKDDDNIVEEWKLLSRIIDRCFFWISLSILIIVLIVIIPK